MIAQVNHTSRVLFLACFITRAHRHFFAPLRSAFNFQGSTFNFQKLEVEPQELSLHPLSEHTLTFSSRYKSKLTLLGEM